MFSKYHVIILYKIRKDSYGSFYGCFKTSLIVRISIDRAVKNFGGREYYDSFSRTLKCLVTANKAAHIDLFMSSLSLEGLTKRHLPYKEVILVFHSSILLCTFPFYFLAKRKGYFSFLNPTFFA